MSDKSEVGEGSVTVALNVELCIGVGNCELLQPDHFTIDEDTGVAELTGTGTMSQADAELVVDRCPSGALEIKDPSGALEIKQ